MLEKNIIIIGCHIK